MLIYLLLLALLSFVVTYFFTSLLIPRLKRFGITGNDLNKQEQPEVAEMGGIAIVAGFTAGVLLAVFLNSFLQFNFNLVAVLAALITIHSIAFIGIVDDLLDVPQWLKAVLPLFASVPLVATGIAGSTVIGLPFIGATDFGLLYIFILIPVGVAVASNLTNMLAGFNGLEAGMGLMVFIIMVLFAFAHNSTEMLVLFVSIAAALAAFLPFNFYPARIFPGDVGNLTIGAVLAAGVIVGNAEMIGALLMLLYVADFFIKAANKFPSKDWHGEYRAGKLYPIGNRVRGLAQLVMKLKGGITEINLVLLLIAAQALLGVIILALYL